MRRRDRRDADIAGLSFLDCICCGFGAIILLLVVVKIRQPILLDDLGGELMETVAHLRAVLDDLFDQTDDVEQELAATESRLEEQRPDLHRARLDSERLLEELKELEGSQVFLERMREIYDHARESTEQQAAPSSLVGGIPADAEYIIFVIDTSGSMVNYNWSNVVQKIQETLDVHPRVKGVQVFNDMGKYMFSGYKGRWIPDTDRGREIIMRYLRSWRSFSNSSPVEGITKAIRTFSKGYDKISIYVFGDEFTGDSIQEVVDEVDRLNRAQTVRIHAVGFSVIDQSGQLPPTIERFATLMRVLCQRNGGTFVALQPSKKRLAVAR
ncbi:MAG: VWA domain-containing protein [Deltaproteobacteria bacterium]|nr:VWA domain-containing protein [Deltaproteobacteria bacterium]MBW2414865.1 VWA domain-containing protein [Deltaproteobacteria bacterium]